MKVYRQGDVILKPTSKFPEKCEEKKDKILATGEATGHAHRVLNGDAILVLANDGLMFIRVKSDVAEIGHEEHESIMLPMGDYEVSIQRELDWLSEEVRRVID